jgi:WD40 repeat protein
VPEVHQFYPRFAIWSPDGRYLITPTYYGGRVQLPGESLSPDILKATRQAQAPVLPVRDSALRAIYQSDQAGGPVAWRPDGQVLAVWSVHNDANLISNDVVTLYNCASGKVLARFDVPPATASDLYPNLFGFGAGGDLGVWLRWSPDGSRLLLFSGARGTITIWGPTLLPRG